MSLFKNKFKFTDGHMHAWCMYAPVSWKHYAVLAISIIFGNVAGVKSITTHLPLELQHRIYPRIKSGRRLIAFGKILAAIFRTKLYWENAPLFNYGVWNLKCGQTDWEIVPYDIALCLDTGHAMIGAQSSDEARNIIRSIFQKRQAQIKHFHIHENDLVHDIHLAPNKIITKELIAEITRDRTYIFEIT